MKKMCKIISLALISFFLIQGSFAAITQPLIPQTNPINPQNIIPTPPDFESKAYIAMDANSGYVIAEKNADAHLPPASLTKLMTLYITAQALKNNQIHLTDQVVISEKAWRMSGSKMFIRVGSTVSVQQLIDGIIIASGNDASYAIAEYIGGTEQTFVKLMNQTAAQLGMKNTNFTDSNGLPEPLHYSSARDIAILSRAIINNFPEFYPWFKQHWIIYNGIKQPNRNRLLWRDNSVDGLKTGHTDEAGFCLAASAVRNGMRLITVVLGTPSDEARVNDSEALLNYGFRFYETRKLFAANTPLSKPKVWLGSQKISDLGLKNDLYITLPIGQFQNLKATITINLPLKAPIIKGQNYGNLIIMQKDKKLIDAQLVALADNPRGGIFKMLFGYIGLFFSKIF